MAELSITENTTIKDIQKYFSKAEDVINFDKYIRANGNELGINVKWYYPKFNEKIYSNQNYAYNIPFLEEIYQTLTDAFWYKANLIARCYGYAACTKYGRSDGWAVPLVGSQVSNNASPIIFTHETVNLFDLDDLIWIKIFALFAYDIESLFKMIKTEVRYIETPDQLIELRDRIYDL